MKPYTIRIQGGQMIRTLHLRKTIKHYITSNAQIMDAGCDTGRDAIYLSAKYPDTQITALDICQKAIDEANIRLAKTKLKNVSFHVADLLNIDYSEKFDIIYSIDVLEHIDNINKCLENLYNALKPYGKLIIHVPCPNQKRHFKRFENIDHPQHIHIGFTAQELADIIQSKGFQVIDSKFTAGWFGSLAWEIFALTKKSGFLKRLLFPIVLLFAIIDSSFTNKEGNSVIIIAQKTPFFKGDLK